MKLDVSSGTMMPSNDDVADSTANGKSDVPESNIDRMRPVNIVPHMSTMVALQIVPSLLLTSWYSSQHLLHADTRRTREQLKSDPRKQPWTPDQTHRQVFLDLVLYPIG